MPIKKVLPGTGTSPFDAFVPTGPKVLHHGPVATARWYAEDSEEQHQYRLAVLDQVLDQVAKHNADEWRVFDERNETVARGTQDTVEIIR